MRVSNSLCTIHGHIFCKKFCVVLFLMLINATELLPHSRFYISYKMNSFTVRFLLKRSNHCVNIGKQTTCISTLETSGYYGLYLFVHREKNAAMLGTKLPSVKQLSRCRIYIILLYEFHFSGFLLISK